MVERPSLLIVAVSGRALAGAARRAGFAPLVADFFADRDTQAMVRACRKLDGSLATGMQWTALKRALDELSAEAPSPPLGVVCGAGFEDRPHLLGRIAKRFTLLGNAASAVARVKDPKRFFIGLDRLGIAHPETQFAAPRNGAGWLAKRRGGAGGSHILPSRLAKDGPGLYYQRRVAGRAVSALFVANGEGACVLGFSEQWTAPSPRGVFRYGGAVTPATLGRKVRQSMTEVVEHVAEAFRLKGLGSADFILGREGPLLLEINPRPGATLDVFDSDAAPLLRLHLDAVLEAKLPTTPLALESAAASAIVYAPRRVTMPPFMVWPDWAADIPKAAELIDKNRPICTVLARAPAKIRAKRLAEARTKKILKTLRALTKGKTIGQAIDKKGGKRRRAALGLAEYQRQGSAARARADR